MGKVPKILIVEDDVFIHQLIGHMLDAAGYDVSLAATAAQALSLFSTAPYALVMLDLGLPDEDGLTVARQLRSKSDVPIIVLSAREDKASRIAALDIGVDDYLLKPVEPQELVFRVRNILRRRAVGGVFSEQPQRLFRFEGWILDQSARTLTNPDSEEVHLTKAEFELMAAFVIAPNRVLERGVLLDAIGRTDQPESDRTVDVLISRLRNKI